MAIHQVTRATSITHLIEPLLGGSNDSQPTQGYAQNHSLSTKIVEWIHAERPFFMQVAVYSTIALTAIALIISAVGIPFVAEVIEENSKYDEIERLRMLDQPIITLIGGQSAYEQLPVLSFDKYDARHSLAPNKRDMHRSIMRGTDRYSRPVLFLKIYDKLTQSSFVEMIYRQYSREGKNNPWVRNPSSQTIFNYDLVIKGPALHRLDKVLHGKDRRFAIHK